MIGDIDTLPLPIATGALSLCGIRAIGPDFRAAMTSCGATTVVCLLGADELQARYPTYLEWLRAENTHNAVWFPIGDFGAPTLAVTDALLHELRLRLADDEHLLMHCAGGIGRTGTIAACLLIELGMNRDDALAHIRAHRPGAGPEVGAQIDLVNQVAARHR
ncbi:MAG: tyrosine-protein phosphatase [Actinobacteria bacterium]|nr:tyrosine-protein phosphatase [Actinomycetota bacterium]